MACDGTTVNTGHVGGVIRLMDLHLSKPLQWCVCLLHSNELPLRHLFEHLDGAISDPSVFSRAIGKALTFCEKMPAKRFNRIDCSLPSLN